MKIERVLLLCCGVIVISICGCASDRLSQTHRPPLLPTTERTKHLRDKYYSKPDSIENYKKAIENAKPREEKMRIRNEIINDHIWLIDDFYYKFEAIFYVGKAGLDTLGDWVNLSLTSASAVFGGAEIKSILSVVASGVTGAKLSVDKNFFAEMTIFALVAKMRQLRAEKLKDIEIGMQRPVEEYPLEQALVDIQDYFYAGTTISALQSISEEAGAKMAEAEKKFKKKLEEIEAQKRLERTPETVTTTITTTTTTSTTTTTLP